MDFIWTAKVPANYHSKLSPYKSQIPSLACNNHDTQEMFKKIKLTNSATYEIFHIFGTSIFMNQIFLYLPVSDTEFRHFPLFNNPTLL